MAAQQARAGVLQDVEELTQVQAVEAAKAHSKCLFKGCSECMGKWFIPRKVSYMKALAGESCPPAESLPAESLPPPESLPDESQAAAESLHPESQPPAESLPAESQAAQESQSHVQAQPKSGRFFKVSL